MTDDLMSDSPERAAFLADLWHTIRQEGYAVLPWPMDTYATVGCYESFGVPDVLIHTPDAAFSDRLLHNYVAASHAGTRYAYGRTYYDHVSGRSLQYHPVLECWAPVFHFWELFGERPTPLCQLVWSDEAGRWPWSIRAESQCRLLQSSFTAHGFNWGTTRPGYEPRRWDRPFPTWDDALAWKQYIQTALVRGGWRTPAQAAARMVEWEHLRKECQEAEDGAQRHCGGGC